MPKATRVYANDISSASGERSKLLYLIVCVHNTLMEHFYLNYNVIKSVEQDNEEHTKKMIDAATMLKSNTQYAIS